MQSYVTGEVIRGLREKRRLTQRDLAQRLNVSDKTISKWETGRGLPDITLLEPLAGALSVSAYCASLEHFVQRAGAYADTEWRGGHCSQAGIPGTPAYNPPRMQVARDMIVLCKRLLAGQLPGEPVREPNAPGGHALRARWGTAGMVYTAVK